MATEASPYIDEILKRMADDKRQPNLAAKEVIDRFEEFQPPYSWAIELASRMYWEFPNVEARLIGELLDCKGPQFRNKLDRSLLMLCACGRPGMGATSRAQIRLGVLCAGCLAKNNAEKEAEHRAWLNSDECKRRQENCRRESESREKYFREREEHHQWVDDTLPRLIAGALRACQDNDDRRLLIELIEGYYRANRDSGTFDSDGDWIEEDLAANYSSTIIKQAFFLLNQS